MARTAADAIEEQVRRSPTTLEVGEATGRTYVTNEGDIVITQQKGMFSYSGLTKDQMVRLRNEFGVYGTDTGRICVAALNDDNVGYVSESIAAVLKG